MTEVPLADFDVVVFENGSPFLVADPPTPETTSTDFYRVAPSSGANEVIVYAADHDLQLAEMGVEKLARIIAVWADRYAVLGARDAVDYVLILEDRSDATGHPHGQIAAYPEVPPRAQVELHVAAAHLATHGRCVFCDVVARERADGVRIVARNEAFLAFVPFAARFPYEVHVTAHRHATSLLDLSDPEREALARILREVLGAYDRLFGFRLPYTMAMHQSPTDDGQWLAVSHLHVEFTPSHLAGAEPGAGAFRNEVRPEVAAASLRAAAR